LNFASAISRIDSNLQTSKIAEAARESLGDNTLNLAINLSSRPGYESKLAALRLASGLPLKDIMPIFANSANLARQEGVEYSNRLFIWSKFFWAGMHSLYLSAMINKQRQIIKPKIASKIINEIVQDLIAIANRFDPPEKIDTFLARSIRSCTIDEGEPAMDSLMYLFSYRWDQSGEGRGGDYVKYGG